MKKRIKTFISLILLLSVLVTLTSCEILGLGDNSGGKQYTGGLRYESHFYNNREIHWLETFEEAMTAIEHLRAAGNDIPNVYIADYENETVDAKYLFVVNTYKAKRLKDGEEWYDRKLHEVERIEYYGFLESVTIEELEYSYISIHKYVTFGSVKHGEEHEPPVHTAWECKVKLNLDGDPYDICDIIDGTNDYRLGSINYWGVENHNEELPEKFHYNFTRSLTYIGD